MNNLEYYSVPGNNKMVLHYAMRGVRSDSGAYSPRELLEAQCRVYEDWLATMKAQAGGHFECSFYEWGLRRADTAFTVKPGDLVKYKGTYCIVRKRPEPSWVDSWRIVGDVAQETKWPQPMCCIEVECPDGSSHYYNMEDGGLEPADIPQEILSLARGRAKDCSEAERGPEE